MCLYAARLPGGVDDTGELTDLMRQDRTGWDGRLIARGLELLEALERRLADSEKPEVGDT